MSRAERIRRALDVAQANGTVTFWQCCGGMPGLRWTVAGRLIGAVVYGPSEPVMTCERSYSTREVEEVLRSTGHLAG